jgi:hypothetical protein
MRSKQFYHGMKLNEVELALIEAIADLAQRRGFGQSRNRTVENLEALPWMGEKAGRSLQP